MFFLDAALKTSGKLREIIREDGPRPLSHQGLSKTSSFFITAAALDSLPFGNNPLFHGHRPIQVSDKLLFGNGRDVAITRSPSAPNLSENLFIDLNQGCDFDEGSGSGAISHRASSLSPPLGGEPCLSFCAQLLDSPRRGPAGFEARGLFEPVLRAVLDSASSLAVSFQVLALPRRSVLPPANQREPRPPLTPRARLSGFGWRFRDQYDAPPQGFYPGVLRLPC